jgi:hypothetical protein
MNSKKLGGVYGCKKTPQRNFNGFKVLQGK